MDLSRELPVVIGNVDYQEFTWRLIEVDRLLRETGIENDFREGSDAVGCGRTSKGGKGRAKISRTVVKA